MRALAVAIVLAVAAPAAASVGLTKTAVAGDVYPGGKVQYLLGWNITDLGTLDTGVALHDTPPPGHTLVSISGTTGTLNCPGTMLVAPGANATCDDGTGAMRIDISLASGSITVTYQLAPSIAVSTNTLTATCTKGSCNQPAVATKNICTPKILFTNSVNPQTATPGSQVTFTLSAQNQSGCALAGYSLSDTLPPTMTFVSVNAPGATTTTGQTVTITPTAPLPDGATYTATITATVNANTPLGPLVDTATATLPGTPAGNATASATLTVSAAPAALALSKAVSPSHAKIGDAVKYTITATPTGTVPAPVTLTDPIDPALKLTSVALNGQVAACGAMPVTVGGFAVSCGAAGNLLTVAAPATGLSAPLTIQLGATVLPTAGAQVPNTATVNFGASSTSASAPLGIDNGSSTGASLVLTAGKVLAEKGDLVPFAAVVGVPSSAAPLAGAVLLLTPSAGLRIGDVKLTGPDGIIQIAKPTEQNGSLILPLANIPPGATTTALVRVRVNGRAKVDHTELVRAQIVAGANTLASAQADVRIIADPDFDLATVLGEVYRDDNGNGVRDPGERAIEGATIVMDDGLQAVTDIEGRYHLAAVVPGERAIKCAKHTLPPGSRFTTDETRVLSLTPGILTKIDFGVQVPLPAPPAARPAPPSTTLPELRLSDAGGLIYRMTGQAAPGSRVRVGDQLARVDKTGAWSIDVTLGRGRTRLAVITAWPDGRVVVAARDIFWVDRAAGGSLIVPRPEEPRLTLRFPPAALAEPTFLLEGVATSPMTALTIAGQNLPADAQGRVAARLRVPEAGAGLAVEALFSDGLRARFEHQLNTNGDYLMLVGLVEGKLGYVLRDGAAGDSSILAEGRVKLYAKGRIQGRWLLEGALDIDSTQISDWRDLFRSDPSKMFRNLDPDRFYTVYGDSSSTTQPASTRSRLFVRINVDRSELLFGNLQTGLTGVEFGRYSRAVTGGRISFVRASADDPDGPPTTNVIIFGAWLQTQRAHDELRGTGGSLYYLSQRNIVEGSEQVRVEIRDRISDRPLANTAQHASVDYELDYLAGRVMLREPLSSVGAAPGLVRSGPADGDSAFLVVDYEYVIAGDVDDGTVGARATQKIGPVRLGGTFVNEFRSTSGYTLIGGDVQIDLKKYGVIIAEYAHSYGALTGSARSDDGGLTYADSYGPSQAGAGKREGNAWKAEADLHAFGVNFRPYARGVDQGFTDTAHALDAGYLQWGFDADASFWKMKARVHYDERRWQQAQYDAAGNEVRDAGGNLVSLSETKRDIGGEIGGVFGRFGFRLGARHERADDADVTRAGHRTTAAIRIDIRLAPKLTIYATGQYAIEHEGQGLTGRDNSLGSLGAIVELPWQTKLTAEASYGVQGAGGLLGLKSELGPGRVLYGTFTLSQDRDDRLMSMVAAGGRQRISDNSGNTRAVLFAEDQFRDGPVELGGRSHLLATGLDVPIGKRFVFGATFERGTVAPSGSPFSNSPPLDRNAGTLYFSYGGDKLRVQAKGELRQDSQSVATPTAPPEWQWLASGMVTWSPNKDLTLRGKFLFSNSTQAANALAQSSEASLGFSWRPSFTDRLALLGRYTYLDEGVPATQGANGPIDATGGALTLREVSHVVSLAGEGRLFWRISLGEKVAAKYKTEPTENTAEWLILWVNRVSLHVTKRWDAVVEYRILSVPNQSLTHGVSVEANVILVGHLRLGAGWNFSSFGDNELTIGRGDEHGFFARAEGFY